MSAERAEAAPIPMILFCPACGLQHIDEPEAALGKRFLDPGASEWTNPPHRSHLCADCGHVWRPADVPTTGVAEIETTGTRDAAAIRDRAVMAEPVAWRYRYDGDGRPVRWTLTQRRLDSCPARPGLCATIAEPLFTRPRPAGDRS